MLPLLEEATAELGTLLADLAGWRSLDIDYHPPRVERLCRPWREGLRLNLHLIHPCAEGAPLFHPHPWPSAMQVVSGRYHMRVGYGSGTDTPPIVAELTMNPGTCYAMVHPDVWHDVRPLGGPSLSVMLTGRPWNRAAPVSPKRELSALSPARQRELLDAFRAHYR